MAKKMYTGTVTMANGKRKYIRSTSKEEFDKKMQQARLEAGQGVDLTDNTTFGEFAQLWYDTYKKPHLKQNSAEDVLYILNNHIMPMLATKPLRAVKTLDIRKLMASRSAYSQPIQKKILRYLRSIFDAAVENHLIATSPVPKSMVAGGTPTAEKHPLTVEQSRALLSATAGTRAHAAVALMLGAGLRREEVCGLMWDDVDLNEGTIHVRHAKAFTVHGGEVSSDLKSKAAKRDIPIPVWLVNILKAEQAATSSPYVVHMENGASLTHAAFRAVWAIVERRTTDDPALLGKPTSPKHPDVRYELDFHCHPHLLRHTCATRWIEEGLTVDEVQYLLGHSSPDMTLRIYTHYQIETQRHITAAKIRSSKNISRIGA